MIEYLKQKYLLPHTVRRLIRKRPPVSKSIHYADAEEVLIFFTLEGNNSIDPVRKLQQYIENDGKNVSFVTLLLDEDLTPDVHLDKDMVRLTKEEVGFTGRILNREVGRHLRKKYDYFVHADLTVNPWSSLVVACSRANCRIGKHFDGYEDLYDIMIDVGRRNERDHLAEQLYHYLKAL